jgi:proteasome lid subunit RPN8/RPN11
VYAANEFAVIISRRRWRNVMLELAARGRGERESGVFLLADAARASRRVASVVFFDDLDADALNGAVSIRGEAFARLWEICEREGTRVIADIHTHPGTGVAQSSIDAANPMVARRGHVGIIVPQFAKRSTNPRDVGFHIYLGDRKWDSAFGARAAERLRRTWW